MSDPNDNMLQEAIQAISRGETGKAQDILTRLLRISPKNAEYWVWLSAAVDSPKERRYCLQKALAADPDYEPARRGLILMGEMPPDEVEPVVIPKPFAWEARFKPATPAPSRKKELPRQVVIGVLALFLLMALSWGGRKVWERIRPVHVATPQLLINVTRLPTPRPTLTPTPINPLTLGEAIPLVQLLSATYTPTPLPINTPHLVEAYRMGIKAMNQGKWEEAARYFQQTIQTESNPAPDVYFFMGEAYNQMGQPQKAMEAYRQALDVAPHFAPAEVGLAQTMMAQEKYDQAYPLLQQAVRDAPSYGNTYLVLARYHLNQNKPEDALADLQKAEQYLPDSPMVPLYRAEAYLALGDPQKAYEEAKRANARDITLLPAYKLMGEAALALDQYEDAALYLRTYLTYAPDDLEAYRYLAETYLALQNYPAAVAAAEKFIETSPYDADALDLLAKAYIGNGEPEKAVRALQNAVRVHPYNFDLRIELVSALLAAGQPGDAFQQLHQIEPLIKKQAQQYTFYYWRAKVLAALEVTDAAIADWKRILTGPENIVPDAWREEAQQAINALLTPTPTIAPSPTATP